MRSYAIELAWTTSVERGLTPYRLLTAIYRSRANATNENSPVKNDDIALAMTGINIGRDSSPKTHFFYEYEGERAVDPSVLVENGILLWHERMLASEITDLSHLWGFASTLLDATQDTAVYSRIEWLRYKIAMDAIAPKKWDQSRPYPYKGMLTSAIYFQEARRLCSEGATDRVWHVIAIAYYNLGMNTPLSKSELNAKAAALRHARDSEFTRAMVLGALKLLDGDASITSINKAKDAIIALFENKKYRKAREELRKLDSLAHKGTKREKDGNELARLRNTLDDWAHPKGPYPEMAAAFARFNKKSKAESEAGANFRATGEVIEIDNSDIHQRIINLLEGGYSLTMTLSPESED